MSNRFSALCGWLTFIMGCSVAAANSLSPISVRVFLPDEMSHENAATLLNSHEMFSDVQTITLNTGTIPARMFDVEHYQPKYSAFKSAGLIELTSVDIESTDKDAAKSTEGTRVSLTKKGLEESKAWKQLRENEWTIIIATRKVVEVIKIHKQGELIQGIEFLWTWTTNEAGNALKFSYATERAYAKLELVEKSWRIVRIRAL